ncbi:MAG: transglycosylase SLT domain-containing protein, partial [Bacteroidota bacterium]
MWKAQMRNGARLSTFLLFLLLTSSPLSAQLISTRDPISAHTQILLHLDQLENTWEVQEARKAARNKSSAPGGMDPQTPRSGDLNLKLQLSMIQGPHMKFGLFPKVQEFIRVFSQQKNRNMEAVIGISSLYFTEIEKQLNAARLPRNLRFLPVAMSAMNLHAVGEHGPTGLWQLNHFTAVRYGLQCDGQIDERRNLQKSTAAAVRYLKHLHDRFGDWMVAIAAFACGPGGVARAQNRAPQATTFEALYPYLPEFSRDYVPAFVAAAYVFSYHRLLGLEPVDFATSTRVDRVQLNEAVGFRAISNKLSLPVAQLRALNSDCRTADFPGQGRQLTLPLGYGSRFSQQKSAIYALHKQLTAPPPKPEPTPSRSASASDDDRISASAKPPENSAKLLYTIKQGDNLGAISRWYGVPLPELKAWNGIENDYIRAGDRLYVYVDQEKAAKLREVDQMSFDEKQVMITDCRSCITARSVTGPKQHDFRWC